MKLRFLCANIAMGVSQMDTVLMNLRSHFAFHGLSLVELFANPHRLVLTQARVSGRRVKFLRRHVDLTETVRLITRVDADVVVLNEVLPQLHGTGLGVALRAGGYLTTARGLTTHYPDATISTVVASRLAGEAVVIDFPGGHHAGAGGGAAAIRFSEFDITVVGLHMCQPQFPELFAAQIAAIASFSGHEESMGRQVVLAGDWNCSAAALTRRSSFSALHLTSAERDLPTCPTYLPRLKPLDHVFVPAAWERLEARTISFGSDHMAIVALVDTTVQSNSNRLKVAA